MSGPNYALWPCIVLRAEQCSGWVGLCVQNAETREEAEQVTEGMMSAARQAFLGRILLALRREDPTQDMGTRRAIADELEQAFGGDR